MSLHVSLYVKKGKNTIPLTSEEKIFIREDGRNKEISREEWNIRFPGQEPIVAMFDAEEDEVQVFSANITHNLNTMADNAGIYRYLWRPEELEITHANQLIEPLQKGLLRLQKHREHFEQFNPSNGWGTYEGLVEFVQEYLHACVRYPEAEIYVSR